MCSHELIVDFELVRCDQCILAADVFRQVQRYRRRPLALHAPTLECLTNWVWMRGRAAGERFLDGGLQLDGAEAVEQLQQMRGDIADVAADFGRAQYQRVRHRHGMGE